MQDAVPPPAVISQAAFADNFSNGVDPQRWSFVTRDTQWKKQLQCYIPGQARGGRSGLIITVRRSSPGDPAYCKRQPFVSARITTKQAFSFGRLTVRARLPSGAGLWPAIWMRTPDPKPLDGEIDLVEGYGSRPDLYQSTVHGWKGGVHTGYDCGILSAGASSPYFAFRHHCASASMPTGTFDSGFHTFSVEWRRDGIKWFLDGKPYFETTKFVPQQPMAIIIELQLGGVFDGNPTDQTRFPAQMIVSSVRFDPF